MSTEPKILIKAEWEMTSNELLSQMSHGEKVDLLNELCGGSHLPIDQIRRIVNAPGYDDPVVREDAP